MEMMAGFVDVVVDHGGAVDVVVDHGGAVDVSPTGVETG
jgi:hypothetical protein